MMLCPECKGQNLEYITNDIILCECGYSDESFMFDIRYQKHESKKNGHIKLDIEDQDENEEDGDTPTASV